MSHSKNINLHSYLFTLAIPMILSNITVPLLGLVDTAVIGHLEESYFLGGSTVGAMIITAITWLCGFLRMSTTGLSAQAYGGGDKQQGLIILLRGLLVAILISAVVLLFQSFYLELSFSLAGGSEQVLFYARQYSEIRIWGLPAALANLVILGWLLGNHHTKTVMFLLILTNLINLSLDLLFVLGFDWQVRGVALATLVAEYSGLIMGLVVICVLKKAALRVALAQKSALLAVLVDRAALASYFKLNRDILIRTLCLEICFVFMTFQGARLGDDIVAANAILMNFLLLISFGLDGIANAAEVMVGQAKGRGDHQRLKHVVNISLLWSGLFALVYSLVFFIGGQFFIGLISDIPAVVQQANDYFIWIVFLPVISCWCYLYDGVYIGLTRAKAMRNSMLAATFGCFFPVWWLLQGYGNHGLWAAFSVFMLVRGLTLAWHFHFYKNNGMGL